MVALAIVALRIAAGGAVAMCAVCRAWAADASAQGEWIPGSEQIPAPDEYPSPPTANSRLMVETQVESVGGSHGAPGGQHEDLGFDWLFDSQIGDSAKLHSSGRVDYDFYKATGSPVGNGQIASSVLPVMASLRTGGSLLLRETYVSVDRGIHNLDIGRINVHDGVAMIYNPSDVFRNGSLPVIRTEDPTRLRQSRVGVVGVRTSVDLAFGNLAVMVVPPIHPSGTTIGFNPNLGAVNHGDSQAYLKFTPPRIGDIYSNLVLLGNRGGGNTLGINVSSSVGRASIVYLEGAATQTRLLTDLLANPNASRHVVGQAALGFDWTSEDQQTITFEYAYNGAGYTKQQWHNQWLTANSADLARSFGIAETRMDPSNRDSLSVMMQWNKFIWRQSDISCLAKVDAADSSRMYWCQLRYKQNARDWSIYMMRFVGGARSEFGALGESFVAGVDLRVYF